MKKIILVAALLLVILFHDELKASINPPPPLLQDTTIRILVVADTRLTPALVESAIDFLEDSWTTTNLSTITPTSIQIINGGMPILANETVFSGDPDDQIGKIRALVEAPIPPTAVSLRDFHGADVVIGLSFDMDDDCGTAPADNWLGLFTNFVEDENDLDLREANNDYIAVARLTGPVSCASFLAAHEFGHLLGVDISRKFLE